jgi:hypothetical protein
MQASGSPAMFLDAKLQAPLVEAFEAEFGIRKQLIGGWRLPRPGFVRAQDVRTALPTNAVLIDFLRYTQVSLGKTRAERYGALVLAREKEPVWITLGFGRDIETLVAEFQEVMRRKTEDRAKPEEFEDLDRKLRAVLRRLHQQIWSPLESHFPAGAKTVIVAPDGALSFVSFACLMDNDQFVSKQWDIQYVGSGREFLRPPSGVTAGNVMELFADPDFDAATPTTPDKG